MSDWTTNNLAHVATWAALRTMGRNKKTFKASKSVRSGAFIGYSVPGESNAVKKVRADGDAVMLDNIFRDWNGASYEPGYTVGKSKKALSNALVSNKTIAEIAAAADDAYVFSGEV